MIDDVRALVVRFDAQMRLERRASLHTARAYVATAHRLLDFLVVHRGGLVTPADLVSLEATDLRGFLAKESIDRSCRRIRSCRAMLK